MGIEVCLKESEKSYIIPGSEFIISRVAYRDSKSEYYINNNLCSVYEITSLMNNFKIDIDNNRFIILQGEVELISSMNPKGSKDNETGFLEYIEKIVGSKKYIAHINELKINLEKVSEYLNKILDRIKIVEKEKDRLEGNKIEKDVYNKNLWRHYCLKVIQNILLIEHNRINYAIYTSRYQQFINHLIYEIKKRFDNLTYKNENLFKISTRLENGLKNNLKY